MCLSKAQNAVTQKKWWRDSVNGGGWDVREDEKRFWVWKLAFWNFNRIGNDNGALQVFFFKSLQVLIGIGENKGEDTLMI
jgi:hypothetical protein